jgi:predicted O-methyltransferase YrrM
MTGATGDDALQAVTAAVGDVPFMSPAHGRRVFEHIRRTRPESALELGTAHGVSAAYIAAALEANGDGRLTTVDHAGAAFDPPPDEILARAGLAHRVSIVREHSAYTWFLKERLTEQVDRAGNVEPLYDFCYLDGSKNFNVDGLAIVLIERLLRPGGWLLMDDLGWTYEDNPWITPTGDGRPLGPMSAAELTEPHLRAAFDVVARGLPSFTRFIIEDEWYGWAQKAPAAPRRLELKTSRPLSALVAGELRKRVRARRRRNGPPG